MYFEDHSLLLPNLSYQMIQNTCFKDLEYTNFERKKECTNFDETRHHLGAHIKINKGPNKPLGGALNKRLQAYYFSFIIHLVLSQISSK